MLFRSDVAERLSDGVALSLIGYRRYVAVHQNGDDGHIVGVEVAQHRRNRQVVVIAEILAAAEKLDASAGHSRNQRLSNLRATLQRVVPAVQPGLEPLVWSHVLSGHADKEVRILEDSGVG